MNLAFYGRVTRSTDYDAICRFLRLLRDEGNPYTVYGPYAQRLAEHERFADCQSLLEPRFEAAAEVADVDFLFCIGGDGTLLDAVHFLQRIQLPIVAVNAGRLGFLASVGQHELVQVYRQLQHDNWQPDERMLVEATSLPTQVFPGWPCALNEITIHKANTNEMLMVHAYVNGEFLNSYWADGLILSTPTGSTAYNLACGGPIILPSAESLVLTPIAPHSLTVRPVILSTGCVVSFQIESRSGQAMIALDNRTELIPERLEIAVNRSQTTLKLVRFTDKTFFNTLRTRLNWGVDSRRFYS
jgi:NAD+ kinase